MATANKSEPVFDAQSIDALGAVLRAAWTRGTISLEAWNNSDSFTVWLHIEGHATYAYGVTPSEALNKALTSAGAQWPDDATMAAQALKKAKADLAKAQALVDRLSK